MFSNQHINFKIHCGFTAGFIFIKNETHCKIWIASPYLITCCPLHYPNGKYFNHKTQIML